MSPVTLDDYTPEEIDTLEKLIQKYKKTKKYMKFYKVTLYIGYNPSRIDDFDALCNEDNLNQFLYDTLVDHMEGQLGLMSKPEGIGGVHVEKCDSKDLPPSWSEMSAL